MPFDPSLVEEEVLQRPFGKVGVFLRKVRTLHDMSIHHLADIIGCDVSVISHIEGGRRNMTPHQSACICDVFGLDIDEVCTLTGAVPDDIRQEMVKSVENMKKCRMVLGMPNSTGQ